MATEIKATLEELKNIAQEVFTINKKLKELRARKKELEAVVMGYLEQHEKPGIRLDNIVFMAADKTARARKKKTEIAKDSIEVLKRYGIEADPMEVLNALEVSRKGPASSVPVLKMKAAGIFG